MKKSLIAVAVMAISGTTLAQSSVTLFGILDATLASGRGSVSNKQALTNSGNLHSRLGFRGTEDLGGGMNASFRLEAGLNNDDGTGLATNGNNQAVGAFNATTGANAPVRAGTQGLTFNRRSTVSLSSGFGELRLGRDYTPTFFNHAAYDVFNASGVGASLPYNSGSIFGGPTPYRVSNSIGYLLPSNLGGFNGQLQYAMGENASTGAKDGNEIGMRFGYAAGPVAANIAYSKIKFSAGDITFTNLGASYNFGAAKVTAMIDQVKNNTVTSKGYILGVNAPLGASEIRASYASYKTDADGTPKSNKLALGYAYNMSKRTVLYTTVARISNSGGAKLALNGAVTGANQNSTGYDFGIRHSF